MADHTVAATTVASTGTPPTRTPPDAPPLLVSSRVLTAASPRCGSSPGWCGPVPPPLAVLTLSTPVDTRFRGYERLPDMSETSDEPRRSRSGDAVVLADV
jgi:hypothetical protein